MSKAVKFIKPMPPFAEDDIAYFSDEDATKIIDKDFGVEIDISETKLAKPSKA